MAEPGGSAIALVQRYLSSKGLPYTPENVRRALQMNADNPGTVNNLVNGSAENSSGSAAPTKKAAPKPAAKAPVAKAPGQEQLPTPPIPPASQSFQEPQGAAGGPQQPMAQGGGPGVEGLIASLLGLLPGIAAKFSRGMPSEPMGNSPMPPTGRMIDVPGDMISGPQQLQIKGPQPSPGGAASSMHAPAEGWPPGTERWSQPQGAAQSQAPQAPQSAMKLLPEDYVQDVKPIGQPQPGRMQAGPSSPIPEPAMPPGAAAGSNVASRAPVSIVPRAAGADAADLGGHFDWAKILGELAPVAKKLRP